MILGRSHIKAVAESRKAEIEKFLTELMRTSPEISHVSYNEAMQWYHNLYRSIKLHVAYLYKFPGKAVLKKYQKV